MILFDGKTYESSEQDRLLTELENKIPEILAKKQLSPEVVIEAVECLRNDLLKGRFDELLASFPADVVDTLSKEHLHKKLETELGNTFEYTTGYIKGFNQIKVRKMPLGVLFHIAAGNMDFLPAYSLAEGLMTGNINILKLPSADNGLSLKLIMQLIEYRPELKDYIYVFDTSSSDIQGMRKMADLSNAVSVWGSDMAIEAVRGLAPTGVKIIEWGQKLGFCYITKLDEVEDAGKELEGLAKHIAQTKQLLCSSCQVIYLDTSDMEELKAFGKRFLPILEDAVNGNKTEEIGVRARDTLVSYTQRLKAYLGEEEKHDNVIRGKGCSVIISSDSDLELSPMMCNVLVKPLPRENIGKILYEGRFHLQTAGLICPKEDREHLAELFTQCGLIRVTNSSDMSAYFPGECHDGEYALSRYVRIVNVEV